MTLRLLLLSAVLVSSGCEHIGLSESSLPTVMPNLGFEDTSPPAIPVSVAYAFDASVTEARIATRACGLPYTLHVGEILPQAFLDVGHKRFQFVSAYEGTGRAVLASQSNDLTVQIGMIHHSLEDVDRMAEEENYLTALDLQLQAVFFDRNGTMLAQTPLRFNDQVTIWAPAITGQSVSCATGQYKDAIWNASQDLANQLASVVPTLLTGDSSPPPTATDRPTALLAPATTALPDPPTAALPDPPTAALPDPPTTTLPDPPTAALSNPPTTTLPDPATAALSDPPTAALSNPPTAALLDPPTAALPDPPTTTLPDLPTAALPDPPTTALPDLPTATLPDLPTTALPTPPTTAPPAASSLMLRTRLMDANENLVLESGEIIVLDIEVTYTGTRTLESAQAAMDGSDVIVKAFSDVTTLPVDLGEFQPGETKTTEIRGRMPLTVDEPTGELIISLTPAGGDAPVASHRILAPLRDERPASTPAPSTPTRPAADTAGARTPPDRQPSSREEARSEEAYVAVLIGMDAYRDDWPDAYRIPTGHMKAVGATLQATGAFTEQNIRVLEGNHAAKSDVEEALFTWGHHRIGEGSVLLVYFAGQAVKNPTTGAVYLVPHEGSPDASTNRLISLRTLQRALGAFDNRLTLLLIDAPLLPLSHPASGSDANQSRPARWDSGLPQQGIPPIIQIRNIAERENGDTADVFSGLWGGTSEQQAVTVGEFLDGMSQVSDVTHTIPNASPVFDIRLTKEATAETGQEATPTLPAADPITPVPTTDPVPDLPPASATPTEPETEADPVTPVPETDPVPDLLPASATPTEPEPEADPVTPVPTTDPVPDMPPASATPTEPETEADPVTPVPTTDPVTDMPPASATPTEPETEADPVTPVPTTDPVTDLPPASATPTEPETEAEADPITPVPMTDPVSDIPPASATPTETEPEADPVTPVPTTDPVTDLPPASATPTEPETEADPVTPVPTTDPVTDLPPASATPTEPETEADPVTPVPETDPVPDLLPPTTTPT